MKKISFNVNDQLQTYGSRKIINIVLYGTFFIAITLTSLLIIYDISIFKGFRLRTFLALLIISYLSICVLLNKFKLQKLVSWLIIVLYLSLAFATILLWSINVAFGIFAISFVIILTGFLLGPRAILPVFILISFLLVTAQLLHSSNLVKPDLTSLDDPTSFFDVITYTTIVGAFALITWLSTRQIELMFTRAKIAEERLRNQKESIAQELERESKTLRQTQLNELHQLYKFASLGQQTAATLHDLSNHLSILNMDIDDINQQLKNSQTIKNAKESISQINSMVRQVRQRIDTYDSETSISIIAIIQQALKDCAEKIQSNKVKIIFNTHRIRTGVIKGDPLALTQIITIVLNNAVEACSNIKSGEILIDIINDKRFYKIRIKDNGEGIKPHEIKDLFIPKHSSKQNGLGVGLYIAKSLTESQFNGSIEFESDEQLGKGASFVISLLKND